MAGAGRRRDRVGPGAGRPGRPRARGGGPRGAVRRPRRDGPALRRGRRCCSATPSTTRPRPCCSGLTRGSGGRSLAGMRRRVRPLPPAAARRDPHRHGHRVPGRGDRVLERPAQHRPGVRAGAGAPQGAAGPRGRARPGRHRRAGPHRRPAPRRHGAARPARRGRPTTNCGRREEGLETKALADLPPAIRSRVLRLAALDAGAPASELFHVHVVALGQLLRTTGSGSEVQLPGPGDGVPVLERRGRAAALPAVPLCKADRHGRSPRRVRPGRGALHRGPDPGAAPRAGRADRGRLRRARTCCSSASCAARRW